MKRTSQSAAAFPKRDALVRREFLSSSQIPYTAHLSEHVIRTKAGDYVQVFRLAGASFESADDEQLNTWHERLNVLWRNIASAQVALWAHVIRRREIAPREGSGGARFANILNGKAAGLLVGQTLMVNEWYLAVVY